MSELGCDLACALVFSWFYGCASFIWWAVSLIEAARCPVHCERCTRARFRGGA